jgi:hypothetical protein
MTRMDYPQSGLTALLDALERELFAAHADEVRDAWRESGRARNIACHEVRALLNKAIAASEEGSAAPPPDTCTGLDRLLGVSRQLRPGVRCHSRASAVPAWSCRPALMGRVASVSQSKRLLWVRSLPLGRDPANGRNRRSADAPLAGTPRGWHRSSAGLKHTRGGAAVPVAKPRCLRVESRSSAAKLRRLSRNRRKYAHAPAAAPRCPSKPSAASQACCIAIS